MQPVAQQLAAWRQGGAGVEGAWALTPRHCCGLAGCMHLRGFKLKSGLASVVADNPSRTLNRIRGPFASDVAFQCQR